MSDKFSSFSFAKGNGTFSNIQIKSVVYTLSSFVHFFFVSVLIGGTSVYHVCISTVDWYTYIYSSAPTVDPTPSPTNPTSEPTDNPSVEPTVSPTDEPTKHPTLEPTTAEPTTDPTSKPTRSPTTDPTIDPTFDPTFQPTIDPTFDPPREPSLHPSTSSPTFPPSVSHSESETTTGWPTMEMAVVKSVTMSLNATFNDLESYAAANNVSNEEVAEMIVESVMNVEDNSTSNNVDITISNVREGSVIIDYELESNIPGAVNLALSEINNAIGRRVIVSDEFSLILLSNAMMFTTDEPTITDYRQRISSTETKADAKCTGDDCGDSGLSMFCILVISGAGVLLLCLLVCVGVASYRRRQHKLRIRRTFGTQRERHSDSRVLTDGSEQRPIMEDHSGLFPSNYLFNLEHNLFI